MKGERPLQEQTTTLRIQRWRVSAALLVVLAGGCRPALDSHERYGRLDGMFETASINGTGLLATMLETQGADVSSWQRLSRRLDHADAIVWFPRDASLPSDDRLFYLEDWLLEQPGRTLVFVGRDYDATAEYWSMVRQRVTGDERLEATRRLARARLVEHQQRAKLAAQQSVSWFTLQCLDRRSPVDNLSGPWAATLGDSPPVLQRGSRLLWRPLVVDTPPDSSSPAGVDTTGAPVAEVETIASDQLAAADDQSLSPDDALAAQAEEGYQVLLTADDSPFVWQIAPPYWQGSRLIVITNASFLLNYPLSQPPQQQLAQRLVESLRGAEDIVFLESGDGGPSIVDSQELPLSGLAALSIWPLGPILILWLLVGILYCLAVFPIFGRARTPPEPSPADFGAHVRALAELLARTGNLEFARQRVQKYRQLTMRKEDLLNTGNPFQTVPQTDENIH